MSKFERIFGFARKSNVDVRREIVMLRRPPQPSEEQATQPLPKLAVWQAQA